MGKNLYGNIRGAMAKKGLTQEEMAKMLDMSFVNFNRKINGARNWTLRDVTKLMAVLDLTFDEVSKR